MSPPLSKEAWLAAARAARLALPVLLKNGLKNQALMLHYKSLEFYVRSSQ